MEDPKELFNMAFYSSQLRALDIVSFRKTVENSTCIEKSFNKMFAF